MKCVHPMVGLQNKKGGPVKMIGAVRTMPWYQRARGNITLRCGQCIGCRLERSRQWAIRCMHEASLHDQNCFITLTFADEHLPADRNLCVTHVQKFMKRLRKHFAPRTIRFYACGEYGEQYQRPHYHLCLFNINFADKYYWAANHGNAIYRSPTLEQLWQHGNSTIGELTFQSAAYVARYVTKKVTGTLAKAHYTIVDATTGELHERRPEFSLMSRRPGIGANWLSLYRTDVYPRDEIFMRGKFMKPPRYYDLAFELFNPDAMEKIRQERRKQRNPKDSRPQRLAAQEAVTLAQNKNLTRRLQ